MPRSIGGLLQVQYLDIPSECQGAPYRADHNTDHDQDERQRHEVSPGDEVHVLGGGLQLDDEPRVDEESHDDADDRAEEPFDHPLHHERPADEPVGRTDQLHDADLGPPGVDRHPDRDGDERNGDQAEGDHYDEPELLDGPGDPEHLVHHVARVLDLFLARLVNAHLGPGLDALRDHVVVLGVGHTDLELRGERVAFYLVQE
jgi:hypothetical protein